MRELPRLLFLAAIPTFVAGIVVGWPILILGAAVLVAAAALSARVVIAVRRRRR